MLASNFMGRPEAIFLRRVFFTIGGSLLAALSPVARRPAPLPARHGLPCSSPSRPAPVKRLLTRGDLNVIQISVPGADNTFITSDDTSPYNSAR